MIKLVYFYFLLRGRWGEGGLLKSEVVVGTPYSFDWCGWGDWKGSIACANCACVCVCAFDVV